MGGFASCMPDDADDIRRPGVTADGQPQRRGSQRMTHQHQQHQQHQQQAQAIPRTQQHDDISTAPARVLRERHSAHAPESHPSVDHHANARICVQATPNGKEKATFNKFCPICMMYFKEIYKSACCSNYVCVPCAFAHIEHRLALASTPTRMPVGPIPNVCCPSCNTENVSLLPVQLDTANGERPRNYAESPLTKDLLAGVARHAKQVHVGGAATLEGGDDDKENAPASRAGTFHKKILDFEDEALQRDDDLESAARTTTRPTDSAHAKAPGLAASRLPSFEELVRVAPSVPAAAQLPAIVPFQQTAAGNPLHEEDDDDVPSILPPLPTDDLPTLDHTHAAMLDQPCVIRVLPPTPV